MENQENLKRFSDEYPSEATFDAEQTEVKAILDKDIIVKDIAELTGEHGTFLVVLAEFEEKQIQFAIGSQVIMPKLVRAKKDEKLPLIVKIVERKSGKSANRYYDIE